MPKKKENLLEKIVQKDYNNELEKVIETKDFDEDVKNLLLSIFYKVEVSYEDYKKVKRKVESKQEYIEKLLKIIQDDCKEIKTAKPNTKEAEELGDRTFLVDKENKKIICFPVERKLLYSISKIEKQDEIIRNNYFLVNKTISDMINIGNNINTVEPLRDFNGWSWMIIKKEIENISYNLIYQNLRILLGEKFLNSWITNKEYIIDYYNELKNELSERFGKEIEEEIIVTLEKLSILLEMEINPEYTEMLSKLREENEKELEKFQNNQEFIEKLTKDKKQINTQLKKIEKILTSKDLLKKEYTKRNEELSLDKKIFSIKILENQMKKEKAELLQKLEEKNELLNPKKFVEEKTKLEYKQKLLEIVNIKDKRKEKNKILEELQKLFLKCFLVFINNAETKEEIIDLIYILRYYNHLPFNEKIDISANKLIKESLKDIKENLLKKSIDYKIIIAISQDIDENIQLLQHIFNTKIISLEDIHVSIIKEKDKYYIEFSEDSENSYSERIEIENIRKEMLNVKLNKKVKVLD